MTPADNKARVLDMLEHVMNAHHPDAITDYTNNPAIIGTARGMLGAFPDLHIDIHWIVAEDDLVVVFHDLTGTHLGPWLYIEQPTERVVHTSFTLAFRFDDCGQIVDQWLGSNFIQLGAQLGWGFAPVGGTVPTPA
jgi:hypothetical protein